MKQQTRSAASFSLKRYGIVSSRLQCRQAAIARIAFHAFGFKQLKIGYLVINSGGLLPVLQRHSIPFT
jgi:hypothetical protein